MLENRQNQNVNKVLEFKVPIRKSDKYFMTEKFQCPLCPEHMDEESVEWSFLLHDFVCFGCTHDIHNGFVGWDDQPGPEQYNHADTIERIIQITGQTYQQLKCQYMRHKIEEWGGDIPEVCEGVLFPNQPDSWLKVLNKQLDREFLKLVERRKEEQ